jgi:flagellar protein FlaF
MSVAAQAYARVAKTGLTTRQLEAEALSRCALDLEAAGSDPGSEGERLLAAIELNRELWSIIAMSLRDPDNPLPLDAKGSMRVLANFVFARTHRIAESMDPSLVRPLAGINRQIAAGLRGSQP